ncbi:MAG: PAC2 family protein [Phycisphaerales bacterium]
MATRKNQPTPPNSPDPDKPGSGKTSPAPGTPDGHASAKSPRAASERKALAPRPRPWLIAAWPGMGHVGIIAAGALVNQLRMKPIGEFSPEGFFDLQHVLIKDGVVQKPHLPRTVLYSTPKGARTPLYVLLSEAQPTANGFAMAHKLLEKAAELGVERIVTFASLATNLHPAGHPRVTGAATDAVSGADLKRLHIGTLADGAVAGMSGILLGAAAERGMPGFCLLGEIPAFAAAVPNPKAAEAVLATFGVMHNLPIDTRELAEHGKMVQDALLDMLEKSRAAADLESESGVEDEGDAGEDSLPGLTLDEHLTQPSDDAEAPSPEDHAQSQSPDGSTNPGNAGAASPPAPPPPPDPEVAGRIEALFDRAATDRAAADELKTLLDEHKLFPAYENRFLDLFKRE